jgi:hypothetical protein
MIRAISIGLTLVLLSSPSVADDSKEQSEKLVSGMSIVGNDEAPKALVIVPWKSSALGDTLDVSKLMDNGRQPVDKEVFGRALDYYEIRTGSKQ